MIKELNEQGYEVGCKIYDGCLVQRKEAIKLPRAVIASCVRRIEVDCGFTMPLWEKCLRCGEKLGDCTCRGALEPCIDCGETFAACACE